VSAEDVNRNWEIDYAAPLSAEDIARGEHRKRVGRKWKRMGPLQLRFLKEHGMRRRHVLLDVGCGPLRAGRHFVRYLHPGNYYGIDVNATLLDAGYDLELSPELRERLPRDHLRATERFDCDFGVLFDYAIANSVFTHVSLNHIRLCLYRLAPRMRVGGRFYATFFDAPDGHPLDRSLNNGRRWTERNAFFYYLDDLRWAADPAQWEVTYIGDWGHPGRQAMVEFRRIDPRERSAVARARRVARTAARRAARAVRATRSR
jgi:SAM-dependent methyltransferase